MVFYMYFSTCLVKSGVILAFQVFCMHSLLFFCCSFFGVLFVAEEPTLVSTWIERTKAVRLPGHVDAGGRCSLNAMVLQIGVPPNHPILIGFFIINHPFWGTTIFGNT